MNDTCAGVFEDVPLTEAAIMEGSKGSGKFGLNHRSYTRIIAQYSPVTGATVRSSQTEHALKN